MSRMIQTISLALLTTSLYLLLLFGFIPLPAIAQTEIIPLLPFWAVVSLGAYLLARLGWGLFTFSECPDAYDELQGEIKQAKIELRAMGVDVD